jgi:hypothetical protein
MMSSCPGSVGARPQTPEAVKGQSAHHTLVLGDRAESNTRPAKASHVANVDHRRVGLQCDAVVSTLVHHVLDGDVVRPVRVEAVGVLQPVLLVHLGCGVERGRVDVKVLDEYVLRVDGDRGPELGLDDGPILDNDVFRIDNGERHRSAVKVPSILGQATA